MIEEAAVCWMEAASVRRRARGRPRFLRLAAAVAVEMTAGVRTKRAVPAIAIVAVGVIVLLQQ